MALFNLKKNIEDLGTNIVNTKSELETNINETKSEIQTSIDTARSSLTVIENNFSAEKDFIKASLIPNDSITNDKFNSNTITQEKIHGGGITPTGTILPFASETPPAGWLLCDGSSVSRTNYPDLFGLFNAEGLPYGSDNEHTFNLPDLTDRIPVGKGSTKTSLGVKGGAMNMTPSGSVSSSASGGEVQDTTLCSKHLPSHDHGGGNHTHNIDTGSYYVAECRYISFSSKMCVPGWWSDGGSSGNISDNYGCGCPHTHNFKTPSVSSAFFGCSMSVEQPYTVINYIIKY